MKDPSTNTERNHASFSLDEGYVACAIACVLSGSTDPGVLGRDKISRILSERPSLNACLASARKEFGGRVAFELEAERVQNVILKLARGHAAFELNEPQLSEPVHVAFAPLPTLRAEERHRFEVVPTPRVFPEVGSRAMQRTFVVASPNGQCVFSPGWLSVDPGRYRYFVVADGVVTVRIVMDEYLGAEVIWG